MRRATGYVNTSQSWSVFLSTLSLRRATRQGQSGKALHRISIHALLAESDGEVNKVLIVAPKFLSTLSLRRATGYVNTSQSWSVFLSTLSLRRATRQGQSGKALHRISIHALLAESDGEVNKVLIVAPKFLSTLSLRRATKNPNGSDLLCGDFYPRSPCGERP